MSHYYNVELVQPLEFDEFGEYVDSWNDGTLSEADKNFEYEQYVHGFQYAQEHWNKAWEIEHNLTQYAKNLGYTVQGSFTPNDDMMFYKNEEHRLTIAWYSENETHLTYEVAFEKKLTERDEILAMVIDYQFTH